MLSVMQAQTSQLMYPLLSAPYWPYSDCQCN